MRDQLRQKIRQFLVHSFLYYQLNESIIFDAQYDQICEQLLDLLPKCANRDIPFRDLVEQSLGDEASGFTIKKYPPSIISAAIHVLYQSQSPLLVFEEFLERIGYRYQMEEFKPI